jgi:hypothetical protein
LSADVVVAKLQARERRVVVQGRRERPRALSADVVAPETQARERRVVVEGRRERPRALNADLLYARFMLVSVALLSRAAASDRAP